MWTYSDFVDKKITDEITQLDPIFLKSFTLM